MINLGPDRANYYKVTAYNSTVTVDNEGRVVAHYRKRFLWYADEVWAQEGGEGFETAELEYPLRDPPLSTATMDTTIISKHGSTNGGEPDPQLSSTLPPAPPQQPPRTTDDKMTKHTTTFAICMDLNTHHFSPPPPSAPLETTHPLASHILSSSTTLLVLSTAWLTNLPAFALRSQPEEPDWDTLACWIERLSPLLDSPENMDPEEGGEGEVREEARGERERGREVICVFANRCGEEAGKMRYDEPGGWEEGEGARYAGSSWIGKMVVGKKEVVIGGRMGRGEEGFCVVDTEEVGKGWKVRLKER